MPKEPYYIEYNPEDNEEDLEEDSVLPRSRDEMISKRTRENDMGIIGGEEPTTTLETDNDFQNELDEELAEQQQVYQDELAKYEKKKEIKETKGKIKEAKRNIRHLKYEPIYTAGETLKDAGEKIIGKIKESRGSPEERKAKRQAMKQKVKRFKEGTQKMMKALGGTGSSGLGGSGQPIQPMNPFFGNSGMEMDMFAREVGGGMGKFDLVSGGKPDNKANNLLDSGGGLGIAKMDLLGGSSGKKTGSFGGDLFGGKSNMFSESPFFSDKSNKGKKNNQKMRLI